MSEYWEFKDHEAICRNEEGELVPCPPIVKAIPPAVSPEEEFMDLFPD